MSKKLLMIANDFPPVGGAGIQRAFYFAKYLGERGWHPIVLTVKDVLFSAKDYTLLEQLPPTTRVVRTGSLELRRVAWLLGRLAGKSRRPASDPRAAPGAPAMGRRWRAIGRSLRKWLFVPDDRMLWVPFVLFAARRLIRREKISSLFATAPPYSSAVAGWLLHELTGLPLVVDLRDPWTQDPYLRSPTVVHRRLNEWLERATFAAASRLIVISPRMRSNVLQRHPELPPEKVTVILNGFDAEELARIRPRPRDPGFTVVYVGSLYAHHRRPMRAFCRAWDELAGESPAFGHASRLWLIGRCDPEIEEELAGWVAVNARVFGYQPHADAVCYLKTASALLLLIRKLDPETDVITIPGKTFEYLGAGAPILMIGPQGDAADIVSSHGGIVHDEDDLGGIRASLRGMYEASSGGRGPIPSTAAAACYDRRALTARLAVELDAVVSD